MPVYISNHIPVSVRRWNLILSAVLLAYGGIGIWIDDLYIPGRTRGVHLHDVPARVMYAAMICAALNLLSVVIDHYDIRNNETNYRLFARITQVLGWILFGLSLALSLFVYHEVAQK
jgi:hypothetical protein